MLTVTPEATEAINVLTDPLPEADTAGLRFSIEPSQDGEPQLALSIAGHPFEGDQVVEVEGAKVFVAEPVTQFMDDKTLDAEIQAEGVQFAIKEQGDLAADSF
jgi:iron-sulfur cluster assembly protein